MLESKVLRLAILFTCAAYGQAAAHSNKAVVCYWNARSWKRAAPYNYSVEDVPAGQCSHLVYSSATIDGKSYNVTFGNGTFGAGYPGFDSAILKRKNPKLALLLRVGHCHDGNDAVFSAMANSSEARGSFARSTFAWIEKHGFDGVALGWCRPADKDRENLVNVVKELRKELSRVNRRTYLLLEVPVAKEQLQTGYNVTALARYVEYFHAKTYSLRGSWLNCTDVHSPLHKRPFEDKDLASSNVKEGAYLLTKLGAPKQKILLGIPFYGLSYTLTNASSHGLNDPVRKDSPLGRPGQYTNHTGVLAYFEVCKALVEHNLTRQWDEEGLCPYAYNGDQWVGYEDEESVYHKAQLIEKEQYGGAVVYTVDMDDFVGKCGRKHNLLKTVQDYLNRGNATLNSPVQKAARDVSLQPHVVAHGEHADLTTTSLASALNVHSKLPVLAYNQALTSNTDATYSRAINHTLHRNRTGPNFAIPHKVNSSIVKLPAKIGRNSTLRANATGALNVSRIHKAPTFRGQKCINGLCITAGSNIPVLTTSLGLFAVAVFGYL